MKSSIKINAFLVISIMTHGCGSDFRGLTIQNTADPRIFDLTSNYGRNEIDVEISGRGNTRELKTLRDEIVKGTKVIELESQKEIIVNTSETVEEGPVSYKYNVKFSLANWRRNKWHKIVIEEPSVGELGRTISKDGFQARFIHDSFLLLTNISICGNYSSVINNQFDVSFSEKITNPNVREIEAIQFGKTQTCTISSSGMTVARSWLVKCPNIDWKEETTISFAKMISNKELRALKGTPKHQYKIHIPIGNFSKVKWCYYLYENI